MVRLHFIFVFISCFLCIQSSICQQMELPSEVENYIEQLNPDTDPALIQEIIENLLFFNENPLNINRVTAEDLGQLQVLSDLEIDAIIAYREKNGDFIRLEELQAIDALDLGKVRLILPFIKIGLQNLNVKNVWKSALADGDRTLFLRYERDFPRARGYTDQPPAFEGSPDQLYTRLRWRYGTMFSLGFTMEKDHGESFFKGSNKQGFDYMSGHLYLRNPDSWMQILAIGDYKLNLGQGLIRHSGYGGGKSSFVMSFNKNSRVLTPYASVDENSFLRGAATELKLSDNVFITLAASYRKRDANQISEIDTFENRELSFISSLQSSGLHRTSNEIHDEKSIQQFNAGGRIQFKGQSLSITLNAWHNQLSDSLGMTSRPDNKYRLRGKSLTNTSLDYSWRHASFLFFGETAYSFPGSIATVNGLMTSIHPSIDIGILHRYLSRDYQVLTPNAFVENTSTQNENGLYLSTQVKLHSRWQLSAYIDLWKHPWLRYQVDAPSIGNEYFAQLKYYHKRTFECYLQYKRKTREQNGIEIHKSHAITTETREGIRLHLAYTINKVWEWRSRIEFSQYYENGKVTSSGVMIYQDVICKPVNFPVSFTSRIAFFQTDSYDSRIYTYENDVLYAYSLPAFYRNGSRFYLNLRYRILRSLTLEGRYAVSFYPYEEKLSSGYNQVSNNVTHGIKFQARINF